MTQRDFAEQRSPSWQRLQTLLERIERRGLRALDGDEIVEFGKLYRWVTSDLAYVRGRHFDSEVAGYLNRLTARAHARVYAGSGHSGNERFWAFFSQVFPQEVRRSWAYVALCAALTIFSAGTAFNVVSARPSSAYALFPANLVPVRIEKSLHDSSFAFKPQESAMISAQIITNNIRVAIVAFAGGMTLGVLTIYIVLFNGTMLGVIGALFSNAGFGYDFWATVAPHGVLELTAIQVSGAAGLLLAAGVLNPGAMRRRDALRDNGRRAGVLILGVAAMLLLAGIIEGFFSPLRFAPPFRVAAGALSALALIGYFGFAGLRARASRAA
ncbi:MAG: stage II sporulation protein M [Candidatus Eremiobacteraeota bacterium]|nr:stage II sporulation protein M [Candidatus Eremiobacteraeota bacterium]